MLVKHVEACRNKCINEGYHGYKNKVSFFAQKASWSQSFGHPFDTRWMSSSQIKALLWSWLHTKVKRWFPLHNYKPQLRLTIIQKHHFYNFSRFPSWISDFQAVLLENIHQTTEMFWRSRSWKTQRKTNPGRIQQGWAQYLKKRKPKNKKQS